jgi:hypothetical protein
MVFLMREIKRMYSKNILSKSPRISFSRREGAVILGLVILLLPAVVGSLMTGRFSLSPGMILEVFRARLSGGHVSSQADDIIFIIGSPVFY